MYACFWMQMNFPGKSINELVREDQTEDDEEQTNGDAVNNENGENDDDENSIKNKGLSIFNLLS